MTAVTRAEKQLLELSGVKYPWRTIPVDKKDLQEILDELKAWKGRANELLDKLYVEDMEDYGDP